MDVLEDLKERFSPLSFEKSLEFNEEMWQNSLTQTISEGEREG